MGLTEHSPRQRSTMDVTIVVSTFGGAEWQELAESRAIPSAIEQAPVIHAHGDTLAKARNQGLQAVESEWVIFLDADDELTPGYVDSMRQGLADLRAPRSSTSAPVSKPLTSRRWRATATTAPVIVWSTATGS